MVWDSCGWLVRDERVDNGGIRTRDLWIWIPVTVIGRPAPPGGAADEEIETG
jgi:hypothetical protein